MIDLLLVHGTVVTLDAARRVLEDGAVAIDGRRIVAVGPADGIEGRYRARKTLDCRGRAVIPSLIDAHGHAGHSLIKTLGCDTPAVWMRIVTPTYFHFTAAHYWYVDGLSSVSSGRSSAGAPVQGASDAVQDGATELLGARAAHCTQP